MDPNFCWQKLGIYFEKALGDIKNMRYMIKDLKHIMIQLIEGLDFIHTNKIVHRDIKPANILLYENNIVKYTDLGSAVYYNKEITYYAGDTVKYSSPESHYNLNSFYKSDIYSLGCVFYYLVYGKDLFDHERMDENYCNLPNTTFEDIKKYSYLQDDVINDLLKNKKEIIHRNSNLDDLIINMILFSPKKRINMENIKNHPFFERYNFKKHTYVPKIYNMSIDIYDKIKLLNKIIKPLLDKFVIEVYYIVLELLIRYNEKSSEIDEEIIKILIYITIEYIFKGTREYLLPKFEEVFPNNFLNIEKKNKITKEVFGYIIRTSMYIDSFYYKIYNIKDIIKMMNNKNIISIISYYDYQKIIFTLLNYNKANLKINLEDYYKQKIWIESYFKSNECLLLYNDSKKPYAFIEKDNQISKIELLFSYNKEYSNINIKYYKLSNQKYLIYLYKDNYICSFDKIENFHNQKQNDLGNVENKIIEIYH